MASASQCFAEPIHEGPDYELAGFPCRINAYQVCYFHIYVAIFILSGDETSCVCVFFVCQIITKIRIHNSETRPIAHASTLAWYKKQKAFAMITGHDIDWMDRTPETLSQRLVFRATLIKTKDLVEFGNIVPRKSHADRNIPAASDDFHFLSDTHYWHSWQHNVIKKSEFVQRPSIQKHIKRFLRKSNFSLQCEVNSLKEELKVKFIVSFSFWFTIFCFYFVIFLCV